MSNLDKDLAEMRRLGYSSYGKYKLDHPNTKQEKPKPAPKRPRQQAPAKEYQQTCSFCGKAFISHAANKMYCSGACCRRGAKKRYVERKAAEKSTRIGKCMICGAEFKQVRSSHKYCSKACNTKASRENQRQWRARLKEAKRCGTITK